jgi:hypothetical protein
VTPRRTPYYLCLCPRAPHLLLAHCKLLHFFMIHLLP